VVPISTRQSLTFWGSRLGEVAVLGGVWYSLGLPKQFRVQQLHVATEHCKCTVCTKYSLQVKDCRKKENVNNFINIIDVDYLL
jgi:hypothetical protein